ncbi:class II fructose-bisphosphate aldolase [Pedococcus sp. 5OH_020]|uniref:class II fructose-bisphosphate aldolase n=1 Tax=Pedococcus sp. 5OH_020 TaxID=2989814 RepID=UPI0022E9E340|nr:class II fructose-bisphosphate aldolase [Pedococcus sp. 5OH_020]
MRSLLHDVARQLLAQGAAVPAITCYGASTAVSVVEAAEAAGFPVVLLVPPAVAGSTEGVRTIRALCAIADAAEVDVVVQLDHTTDLRLIDVAVKAGVDAVLADGSSKPLRDNSAFVHAARDLCGPDVTVEAELGSIAGNEDRSVEADPSVLGMTDPDDVGDFVALSGCDLLAVAVGNVHGRYRGEPLIDRDRLERIRAASSVPLVLHGASGLPREDLARAGSAGIGKVNINTELRGVVLDALAAGLAPARAAGDDVWALTGAQAQATRDFTTSVGQLLSGTSALRTVSGEPSRGSSQR